MSPPVEVVWLFIFPPAFPKVKIKKKKRKGEKFEEYLKMCTYLLLHKLQIFESPMQINENVFLSQILIIHTVAIKHFFQGQEAQH